MTDETKQAMSDVEAALEAGKRLASPFNIAGVPCTVIRREDVLLKHEDLLPRPIRTNAKVVVQDVESFQDYVERFRRDNAVLFLTRISATCIIDYHKHDAPSWCSHQISLVPVLTEEWGLWLGASGKWMDQQEFAEHLERGLPEIVTPTPAHMLEIAGSLEATKTVGFKSGVRLDNGATELRYEETIEARAGTKGRLEIPRVIQIGLRIHRNAEAYILAANFKYRINQGKLSLCYEIVRPQRAVDQSIEDIFAEIVKAVPDIQKFTGTP